MRGPPSLLKETRIMSNPWAAFAVDGSVVGCRREGAIGSGCLTRRAVPPTPIGLRPEARPTHSPDWGHNGDRNSIGAGCTRVSPRYLLRRRAGATDQRRRHHFQCSTLLHLACIVVLLIRKCPFVPLLKIQKRHMPAEAQEHLGQGPTTIVMYFGLNSARTATAHK